MFFPTAGSTTRSSLVGATLAAALILVLAAVPPARAQTDITDSSLPHTADSVLFDWYCVYAPSNVSNDLLGLEYGSWHSGDERTGQLFPHWVQIDFGSPRTVTQLNVLAYSETWDSNLRLKDFRFEGSNDGVTYTPLHEGLLQYANRHEWQSFFFQNTTGYRYYRLYGLSNWGCFDDLCDQMIIEEWEMFGSPSVPAASRRVVPAVGTGDRLRGGGRGLHGGRDLRAIPIPAVRRRSRTRPGAR